MLYEKKGLMFEETITWSYSTTEHVNIYFGKISKWWKKTAYKRTREFTKQMFDRDFNKFMKEERYFKLFDITDKNVQNCNRMSIDIKMQDYDEVKGNIVRSHISGCNYAVKCRIICTVIVSIYFKTKQQ